MSAVLCRFLSLSDSAPLRYKAYRDSQEKLHTEWLERQKIRKEKIARGEEVGPEEKDPTEPEEVGCLGVLKFFLYLIVFGALAGKLFTGSYTWDHEKKLVQLKSYIPVCCSLSSLILS